MAHRALQSFIWLQSLFFVLDLPVDKECQSGSKGDDGTKDTKFSPVSDHDSPKNLSAKLEFQCKCYALGELKPYGIALSDPQNKALYACIHEDTDAE